MLARASVVNTVNNSQYMKLRTSGGAWEHFVTHKATFVSADHDANTATVQIETADGTLNQLSIPMDELAKLNNGQVAIRLLLGCYYDCLQH